jgi:hypothetical protein
MLHVDLLHFRRCFRNEAPPFRPKMSTYQALFPHIHAYQARRHAAANHFNRHVRTASQLGRNRHAIETRA